ncbi:hypothetical protein N7462_000429 [Penicillium macrosclerotiorum]|uniref:uncharacterized protein n=1 Tax=Penicillium macrosclerotiorum TaxID=303699 RepID=UPI002548AC18|nr:uncharacterized protein N7462_000429 [Penicillium macrosclerotiorum]KAJ5698424.1 hypothetical protein N7462_000429 [Penicillium macrosclerotiorum]
MIPKTEKDNKAIEKARNIQDICWGEEYERMVSGMLYNPLGPELIEARSRARYLTGEFNAHINATISMSDIISRRGEILDKLLGQAGPDIYIEPPLFVDYGCNITTGRNFYANFHLTILDCGLVSIGDNVEVGPNVSIITGEHYTQIQARREYRGREFTRSITIGNDCWIGAGAIILSGVTIGDGCSIGAGAVVRTDIPPYSVAVGVPARVIRSAE